MGEGPYLWLLAIIAHCALSRDVSPFYRLISPFVILGEAHLFGCNLSQPALRRSYGTRLARTFSAEGPKGQQVTERRTPAALGHFQGGLGSQ